jgi:hypothetical protein
VNPVVLSPTAQTGGFASIGAPAACSNVRSNVRSNDEDYQIAFLCDNLFLLYLASEITLANPCAKTDETPIRLED